MCLASTVNMQWILALQGWVPLEMPAESADEGDINICLATWMTYQQHIIIRAMKKYTHVNKYPLKSPSMISSGSKSLLDYPQDTDKQATRMQPPWATWLGFSSLPYDLISSNKYNEKKNILNQIFIIFTQEFCRAEHWAQLQVIEPHFGMRLAVIANGRVDEGLVWYWSHVCAHVALEMTGVLGIGVIDHICIYKKSEL